MSQRDLNQYGRSPLYVVLYDTDEDLDGPDTSPFVSVPYDVQARVSVPHGLALDVATALPGLWYCLHLPNTFTELRSLPAALLKANQHLDLGHHIALMPRQLFNAEWMRAWHDPRAEAPVLVVCPDELIDAVSDAATMGFALAPATFSELSDATLAAHWRAIHDLYGAGAEYLGREPRLARRLDLASSDLSRRWLARQMLEEQRDDYLESGIVEDIHARAIDGQVVLAATALLERRDLTEEEANREFSSTIDRMRKKSQYAVVVAAPGVAPKYCRDAYSAELRKRIQLFPREDHTDIWLSSIKGRPDHSVERSALELMVAHRSVASGALGLMLRSIPPKAFAALAELERHFIDGARPSSVWKLLDRLNASCAHLWTDDIRAVIAGAYKLTAFSNFPLGLLRLPGDSAPLAARVPIVYRPILPLTRALQQELAYKPALHLPRPVKVLIAECILPDDRIGALSRNGWRAVMEPGGPGYRDELTVELVETLSVDALRDEIRHRRPDMLIVSAHGFYDPKGSVAGLQIGSELALGPGLGPLPPIVLLSACHVAPRGASTVSITDMLLREGATAVLGTQVPVDVRRNVMLMGRFLVNLVEAMRGGGLGVTLLDVWHHTQGSNAINDILFASNATLMEWGYSTGPRGIPVISDFMQYWSAGRLRKGHVYADSEQVLTEMAVGQGVGRRIANAFRNPGYLPESLFYVLAGWPDRIYLQHLEEIVRAELRPPDGPPQAH